MLGHFSVESADDENVMFSSFNFSWNLSSDVSARCSSHPHPEDGGKFGRYGMVCLRR